MVRVFNLSMYYTAKTGREQMQIFNCIIHDLAVYNKFKFFVVVLARFELATNAV